ncbi:Zinc finger BED domain-containing hypothetical protein [Phytophthora megakarya]|uniref:HAT C-terminal dimerisation domain-containing protein n=1 Tax=Phytophthora megakarya TaxID=4795 RepID=A0A225VXX1_9STRA|nr:Zinc finger BED domain-containing hypothetical protein [Phytophthora megakarya]
MWIAQSQRPMPLIEDEGFRIYLQFIAADLGGVNLHVLSASRSFMAATIHYLDEYFNMANWTLEVEHLPGSHTGEVIAARINAIVSRWGLRKGNCSVLLRDGAANAVSAGDILGVYHIHCVAHALHLVVAGALIKKKGDDIVLNDLTSDERSTVSPTLTDEELAEAAAVDVLRESAIEEVDQLVNDELTREERQAVTQVRKTVDCPTRWSSSFDMLNRLCQLKGAIEKFFEYVGKSHGKKEFPRFRLPRPAQTDWLTIDCLIDILASFALATRKLSGDSYPTLALAYPSYNWCESIWRTSTCLKVKLEHVIEHLQKLCRQI